MSMTFSTTPTAQQLRTLPTAELALIPLASLEDQPNPNNILRGHEQAHSQNREPDADLLLQRVSDAWAWAGGERAGGAASQEQSERLVSRQRPRPRCRCVGDRAITPR